MDRKDMSISLLFTAIEFFFAMLNLVVILATKDFFIGASLMLAPDIFACLAFIIKDSQDFGTEAAQLQLKKRLTVVTLISLIASIIGLVAALMFVFKITHIIVLIIIIAALVVCTFKVFVFAALFITELIK